jgi:hypothetical protein
MNSSDKMDSLSLNLMKFDSSELDNPSNKNLNVFVFDQKELNDFEKVVIQDFSNLETFYKSIREAREKNAEIYKHSNTF